MQMKKEFASTFILFAFPAIDATRASASSFEPIENQRECGNTLNNYPDNDADGES